MTTQPVTIPASLILYGDDFPDDALYVLKAMPEIKIIAMLAETDKGVALARFHEIPLESPRQASELALLCGDTPTPLLMCWLSPSVQNAQERVMDWMNQGVSILMDLPTPASQLTQWVRYLRQSTGQFHFCTPMLEQPIVQDFLAMVATLKEGEVCKQIAIRCAMSQRWPVIAMLNQALGGIRRWNVVSVNEMRPHEVEVNLDIASVSVSLVLIQRDIGQADLPSYFHYESHSGVLSLAAGAIAWQAAGALQSLPLSHELFQPVGRDPQQSIGWKCVFSCWHLASLDDSRSLSEIQRYLTLGRLVDGLDEALGDVGSFAQTASMLPLDRQARVVELSQAASAASNVRLGRRFRPDWRWAKQVGLQQIVEDDTQVALAAMMQALRQLEHICLFEMKRLMISSCGGDHHSPMTRQQIHERVNPATSHAWLLDRWLIRLEKQAWLAPIKGQWYWTELSKSEPKMGLEQVYTILGFPETMVALHQVTLQRLLDLMTGKVTLQEIIFSMEQPIQALSAYQSNAVTACLNAMSANLLEQWLAVQGGRGLAVIEVGAGGGSFTQQHLPILQKYLSHYRFTDLSPLFIERAIGLFPEVSALTRSVLDINQDFVKQGVLPASIDILLAGNVLHNAQDIVTTLLQIRHVLRRGGLLLLTDSTEDNAAMLTSMQFLLSPADTNVVPSPGGDDYRQSGEAFLSLTAWQEVLADTGFRFLGYFPEQEHALAMSGQRVMMAEVT